MTGEKKRKRDKTRNEGRYQDGEKTKSQKLGGGEDRGKKVKRTKE